MAKTDFGDPAAARAAVKNARAALGPVTVLQWSAYDGGARPRADVRAEVK